MKKCINCKFKSDSKFNCEKIIGYRPDPSLNYNGAVYANPKKDNLDDNCKYYEFSIISFLRIR